MKENRPSQLPVLILSGASGFLGRHLLNAFCEEYYIYALARRPQRAADVLLHENIHWIRVDIGNEPEIKRVISEIAENGGADFFLHFAAYFDFYNRYDPEYKRTNVLGTSYILESCHALNLKRFIFASSLAIMDISDPDRLIYEDSSPDAKFPYAISKIKGEKLIRQFSNEFPCAITRLAAMYSDWCEHLPLYSLLSTWLSGHWDHHILAGKGKTAIPYLHVNDLAAFLRKIFSKTGELAQLEILNASPSKSTSHKELFHIAYAYSYFRSIKPIYLPKWMASIGIIFRNFLGWLIGKKAFERIWMIKYIDQQMTVDSSQTYAKLNWKPTNRYYINRRLLFLIGKMKGNPYRWHYSNRMRPSFAASERQYLKIYESILQNMNRIVQETYMQMTSRENAKKYSTYLSLGRDKLFYRIEYIVKMLEIDVCTGDRSHILDYAENLARERYIEKFPVTEIKNAINLTANIVISILLSIEELKEMKQRIYDEIMLTLQMVMDEIEDTYERLETANSNHI